MEAVTTGYDLVHAAVDAWWAEHTSANADGGCVACSQWDLDFDYVADVAWAGLDTALWSSSGNDGDWSLTVMYKREDVDAAVAVAFTREVADFCHAMWVDVVACGAGQTGHDFVLTRNGEGTGFWDRGLGEVGDRLTAQCEPYGGFHLYAGDNGALYAHN
jgi:hypothetical protein